MLLLLPYASIHSFPEESQIGISRCITRIIKRLPCDLPDEGLFDCAQIDIGRPLYVERKGNAIRQVGVSLFAHETKAVLDVVVCNAIERIWLDLALRGSVQEQKQVLKEYNVSFILNGFPLGMQQFPSLRVALRAITPKSFYSMEDFDGKITIRVETESDVLIIILPAERELLFTYDKKEHEDILHYELNQWGGEFVVDTLPALNDLVSINDSIYILPGNTYMDDSLSTDIFYHLHSNQTEPLFDCNYPEYSLRNVLMGYAASDRVILKLDCRGYDRTKKVCMKPLNTFLGYMQKQGLRFHTATYVSDQKLHGVLLMYHPIYGYAHMLVLCESKALYDTEEQVVLDGNLYTFIPQY